jgi:hypothetical protein
MGNEKTGKIREQIIELRFKDFADPLIVDICKPTALLIHGRGTWLDKRDTIP